jgi:hypothetical protein
MLRLVQQRWPHLEIVISLFYAVGATAWISSLSHKIFNKQVLFYKNESNNRVAKFMKTPGFYSSSIEGLAWKYRCSEHVNLNTFKRAIACSSRVERLAEDQGGFGLRGSSFGNTRPYCHQRGRPLTVDAFLFCGGIAQRLPPIRRRLRLLRRAGCE